MARALFRSLVMLSLTLFFGVAHVHAEVLYGALGTNLSTSNLLTLNPANGQLLTTVGPIGFAVTGLAVHPTTGVLYGATSNNSGVSPRSLIRIDKQTGAGTLIGAFGVTPGGSCPIGLSDLTFSPDGSLYGWNENCDDNLYIVNVATGVATKVGNSGISTFGSGMAVRSNGVLYLAGDGSDGALRTVDRATGLTTVVATLSGGPAGRSVAALAFNAAGTLYGVSIDTGPKQTNLLTIDISTGAITDLGQSVTSLDAIVFDGGVIVPSHPVPALNAWGVAVLVLLLAGTTLYIQQRRRA